jgi:hypothetical protein
MDPFTAQQLNANLRLLNEVMPLPNPQAYPPLPLVDAAKAKVLKRFCTQVVDLTESKIWETPSEFTLTYNRDARGQAQELVSSTFPHRENVRGFAVAFRQCCKQAERASLIKCHRILGGLARLDDKQPERIAFHDAYLKAHGILLQTSAHSLLRQKAWEEMAGSGSVPDIPRLKPEQLFSLYDYGDLIHWDSKAEDHSDLQSDPGGAVMAQMEWLDATGGLVALYMIYAEMIRTALTNNEI